MDATLLLLGYCYRINDDIELGIIVNPRVATHPKVDYHLYILSIRLSGLKKNSQTYLNVQVRNWGGRRYINDMTDEIIHGLS